MTQTDDIKIHWIFFKLVLSNYKLWIWQRFKIIKQACSIEPYLQSKVLIKIIPLYKRSLIGFEYVLRAI